MGYQGLFSARLYRLVITVLFISTPASTRPAFCLSSRAFRSRLPRLLRMDQRADALECDQGRVSVPEDVEKCVKSVYVMKI